VKILIELPTWIGDCVMTTPSIENITRIYPHAKVFIVGTKSSVDLFKEHPRIAKSFIYRKNYLSLIKLFISIGKVDLFFSFRSSLRTRLIKVFIRSGKSFQFNRVKYSAGHQVEKYNNFINNSCNSNLDPGMLKLYFEFPEKKNSERPILGINPGASYGESKCWPAEKFVEVIRNVCTKFDVIIFGGDDQVNLVNLIEGAAKKNGVFNIENLAGKTSIYQLCEKINSLSIFLTGDSGPMHIASAYQIPTICIFGPTKHLETNQWKNIYSKIIKTNLDCQPCMKRICPLKHHKCMRDIDSKNVINEIFSLQTLSQLNDK